MYMRLKANRTIDSVIAEIRAVVPTNFLLRKEIEHEFDTVLGRIAYTAPEAMSCLWSEVASILTVYLGKPDTPWKKDIQKIFAGIKAKPKKEGQK